MAEGGLAWIRLPDGSIRAGPMYNLPKSCDGKVINGISLPTNLISEATDPLSEVTNPAIRAEIIQLRERTRLIIERTAETTAALRRSMLQLRAHEAVTQRTDELMQTAEDTAIPVATVTPPTQPRVLH